MHDPIATDLCAPADRANLAALCNLLYDRHLVVGAGGNVSARRGDGFLTTPTGVSLRDMTPDRIIELDADGQPTGPVRPSKELAMHLGIFRARPDVQVVCHVHGSYITALTALFEPGEDTLPCLCPGHTYYAHPLPMLPCFVPGTTDLAEATAAAFADADRLAVLLANHGLITVGNTPADVVNITEEVDEAAMIWFHTGGRARTLPADAVTELCRQRRDAQQRKRLGSA
ncbi:MAG: class II aldolase/adducin family protein [Planctomycetota bacterium]